MERCTVKVRWINDKSKHKRYATGFVIGNLKGVAIILSAGHFVRHVSTMERFGSNKILEVVFFGSGEPCACRVELCIPKSKILILSFYTKNEVGCRLDYATGGEMKLTKGQPILFLSHPGMHEWRLSRSHIAHNYFLNHSYDQAYDPKMILFDHNMDMTTGSSGAAILNKKGNIIGWQSVEYALKEKVMGARPLEDEIEGKKTGDETKDKRIAVSPANLSYKAKDIVKIKTYPLSLLQAVHIKYMDEILRQKLSYFVKVDEDISVVSLNELVERFVLTNYYRRP